MKQTFTAIFVFFVVNLVHSQGIAEFRGPGRQGIYPDTGLLKKWPGQGPELVLTISDFGKGYSQPVVFNNAIFISGTKDSLNLVSAYTMQGKLLWQTVYGKFWIRTYPENRCTPTIEGERLYIASGVGEICCLNTITGKIVWRVDAISIYKGMIHIHGEAESLLLTDKAVVYTTGGEENSMVALKKEDGKLIWKSKSLGGSKSYASPVLIEKAGMKIILTQTAKHLIAINAENGDLLWSYDLMQYHLAEQGQGANTNPPLVHNNDIFITSGYNHPALMFSLAADGRSVSLKWKNDTLDCHLGGVVYIDGTIYGSNWQNNAKGRWASLDWESGKVNWEKEWFNKGSIISADGLLYLYEEKSGNIALVQPDKDKLNVISTFRMSEGDGLYWAHPAICHGELFIRHGNVLKVYNLKP
jgi:outer membrane protein assembly factor BamB